MQYKDQDVNLALQCIPFKNGIRVGWPVMQFCNNWQLIGLERRGMWEGYSETQMYFARRKGHTSSWQTDVCVTGRCPDLVGDVPEFDGAWHGVKHGSSKDLVANSCSKCTESTGHRSNCKLRIHDHRDTKSHCLSKDYYHQT